MSGDEWKMDERNPKVVIGCFNLGLSASSKCLVTQNWALSRLRECRSRLQTCIMEHAKIGCASLCNLAQAMGPQG